MHRLTWAVLLCGSALACFAPARAQTPVIANQGVFTRDSDVSVMERPHPEYDPTPLQFGGFTALPSIDIGAEYNDNIFAAQSNVRSDGILLLSPKVDVTSNWSRNAVGGSLQVASRLNDRYSTESSTDWQAALGGRLDLGHAQILIGGDDATLTEPRYATNTAINARSPVRYDQSDVFVSAEETQDRVRLALQFNAQNLDYHNTVDNSGRFLLEDYRDRWVVTTGVRAEYALSPGASVFVTGNYDLHSYRLKPPTVDLDRDADEERIAAGANFEISRLIRGELEAGYLNHVFASSNLKTVGGFTASGKVEYFPTQLTTVTLVGVQNIQDAGVDGAPVYRARSAALQLDHELLRNLVLTAKVSTEDDRYDALSRHDQLSAASFGARLLLNRLVTWNIDYSYLTLDSQGAERGPQYNLNRVVVSASLRF